MILTSDFWQNVINDEQIDHSLEWESVDCSINRLDEKVHTLVVLADEKGSNLFVGGGPSGIVVALSYDKEHLIARRGNDAEPISIVVGGQAGDYRKRNVISLEQAKDIARAYFEGVDIRTLGRWDMGRGQGDDDNN
jgi:Immunity protein Imm1